ncbi:MAG: transglycosylase domain-containing protein, partial [Clostridia bacterium]|nr:transglycosylase domain-containing protein [Clostridia bacterium]
MKKFLRISAFILLSASTVFASAVLLFFHVTKDAVFDENKFVRPAERTVFLDDEGKAMNSSRNGESLPVSISDLPSYVKYAFISIEDKRFYTHHGVDYRRIAGAALNNLKNFSFKEGASTISQQLIKNTHLSGEKTIIRKLKEIRLTGTLERRFKKDKILETYLNTIYFGEGAYGIERGAKVYFGKSAKDLSVEEAAVLAAVIKAPAYYSPRVNPDSARERRNLVLKCMRDQGYIDQKEYSSAKNADITLNFEKRNHAGSYISCAESELESILSGISYGFYENLNVYTYFDEKRSETLYSELTDQALPCDHGAILCDNFSHGISAAVFSAGMIRRCPASTVKPWLVYAPSIYEKEITEATKILDEKTDFNGFCPSDYGDVYSGYVSVKEALSKSLNVPAVKVANAFGQAKIKSYAKKMNVTLSDGLGTALGAIDGGMTLKEICDCYSVFSGEGEFTEGKFIRKITTKSDKILYENRPKSIKVFDDGTAFVINDCLKECAQSGTAKKLRAARLPLCAKTGTNGNERGNYDAYTISYSPEFTLCVWLGNADNTPMPNSVSGGTYPAIISAEIWKTLKNMREISPFCQPRSVVCQTVDKDSYDKDQEICRGSDGETFYFLCGTEPKEKERYLSVENVKQSLSEEKYLLKF